jgi:alpha-amylase/alpha-mannosidase (GH57 family)
VTTPRYLCIHGHFYQPPRENPWLEAIELQDSAFPYHDWNERITAECYAPNGASRILDGENRIAKIVNNYAGISYNFGPTLLSWMKDHAPSTYRDVLDADRASAQRFSGHGCAIAQCYNHMIMPLANTRDKRTQVRWGIDDFRYRFGRDPEGMWLPETAVDLETLDILAEHGIKFTVLAPSQAQSVDGEDVSGQRIDPTRAYRQKLPSGRDIALFFYDGPIARGVAFEGLLDNGERFANRLLEAFNDQRDWPQLAHIATDGETYGHHHAHGDMALAFALEHIECKGLAKITNYAEYLEHFPPTHDVEILERTAWSCVHGVGRWSANCGCNSGGYGDWNQEWRAPLRAALDWLRDQISPLYEQHAAKYLKEPWSARDEYIQVILDRTEENRNRFLSKHLRRKSMPRPDRVKVWKLLELQRHAMLMYTSCGWFFDELSGIETVQVIQYAGRVVQIAQELFGDSLEARFIEKLAEARSNLPEHRDGALIYEKFVQPARVDPAKLGAHFAMSSLFSHYPEDARIYCYSVKTKDYHAQRSGRMRLAIGQARFISEVTQESEMLMFGVLHFGDHNLHGGVSKFTSDEAYANLTKSASDPFNRSDLPETIRAIDEGFDRKYSLRDLFRDEQRRVLNQVIKTSLDDMEAFYRQTYENQAPLIRFLHECHIPIPNEMRDNARVALNDLLRHALEAPQLDSALIKNLLDQVPVANASLDVPLLEITLRRNLERTCGGLFEQPRDLERLRKCREAVQTAKAVPLPLVLWSIQNRTYAILQNLYPEMKQANKQDWLAEFDQFVQLLELRLESNSSAS